MTFEQEFKSFQAENGKLAKDLHQYFDLENKSVAVVVGATLKILISTLMANGVKPEGFEELLQRMKIDYEIVFKQMNEENHEKETSES